MSAPIEDPPQPSRVVRPMATNIEDEVRLLRQELETLKSRPLSFAGEFFTQSFDGHRTFSTGPYYSAPEPDGSPQWITQIRDVNGAARIVFWDPDPNSGGYVQNEWHWDHLGNIVFTTDNNGGWAEPHLPVVMYPHIGPPAGAGVPNFGYELASASAGTEQTCWVGAIGYVTHSNVWIKGTWGSPGANGASEYKLKVNGVTVGTWTKTAGQYEVTTHGPFNILSAAGIGFRQADIILTARRTSGTGNIACDVLHCHQRQT